VRGQELARIRDERAGLGMYSLFGNPVTKRFSASSACRNRAQILFVARRQKEELRRTVAEVREPDRNARSRPWGGRVPFDELLVLVRGLRPIVPLEGDVGDRELRQSGELGIGEVVSDVLEEAVASIGFWSFFSCMPFSYALAALLASAPVTGLVMSRSPCWPRSRRGRREEAL